MSDVRNSVSIEPSSEQDSTTSSVGKGRNVATVVKNSLDEATESIVSAQQEMQNVEQVPSTINMPTFWEISQNIVVGSSEWDALASQLPTEKQAFVQSYSHLYEAISHPTTLKNYDFSADSSLLDELATFLDKVSHEIEETIEQIYAEIRSMQENGDWDGEAYDAFCQKCISYKEPLDELAQLIKTFSGIFSSVEEETESLAKNITGAVTGTNG